MGLQLVYLLQFDHRVCVNEFREAHESTANADHELIIQDLRVDFPRSEEVKALPQSSDRNSYFHRINILSQQLVDDIALDGLIEIFAGVPLRPVLLLQDRRLLPQCLLQAFDDDLLVPEDVFQSLQLILLLLQDNLQLLALVLDFLDLLFQFLVVLLLFL